MSTRIVVWDIDRVWYSDISTTYCARGNKADYRPYLRHFVEENNWFTYENVKQWEKLTGRQVNSIGALADMLTDFLYKKELQSTVYANVSDQDAKNRTIEGKQALLKGLTIGEVKTIADSVQNTTGLSKAIQEIRYAAIYQVGFSDGLGPFVAYKMYQQGIEVGGIVPALVEVDGEERWLKVDNLYLLDRADTKLLGKVDGFKKSQEIFNYLSSYGYELPETAAIDDSVANIETLKKIRDGGGVSVGFNVNDIKKFEEAKIPVLRGDNLRPFAELVLDPRKINGYCETWGIKV